jgi:hypothetical protein
MNQIFGIPTSAPAATSASSSSSHTGDSAQQQTETSGPPPSPSLTALVPAALRVRRPTGAGSRAAPQPSLSFLSTATKKKMPTAGTTAATSGGATVEGEQKADEAKPESDEAYLSFLEDMKELGAIQEQ